MLVFSQLCFHFSSRWHSLLFVFSINPYVPAHFFPPPLFSSVSFSLSPPFAVGSLALRTPFPSTTVLPFFSPPQNLCPLTIFFQCKGNFLQGQRNPYRVHHPKRLVIPTKPRRVCKEMASFSSWNKPRVICMPPSSPNVAQPDLPCFPFASVPIALLSSTRQGPEGKSSPLGRRLVLLGSCPFLCFATPPSGTPV